MKTAIASVILAFLLGNSVDSALAQDADLKAFYTKSRSFALSPSPIETATGYRYPVITYIPRAFIVFTRDRDSGKRVIAGDEYLRVLTQDGIEVFILEDTVSTTQLSDQYGHATVIFNSPAVICKEVGCNIDNDNDTFEVYGSDVLEKVEGQSLQGWVQLRGRRQGEDFSGFIREEDLSRLNSSGKVTFSDRQHPRFEINKSADLALYKKCGRELQTGEQVPIDGSDNQRSIIAGSGLGTLSSDGSILQLSRDIGTPDQLHVFRKYEIYNRESNLSSTLHAQIQYSCHTEGGIHIKGKIKRALLFRSGQATPLIFDDLDTPEQLSEKIGSSEFLWSVNTREHYFGLLRYLSEKLDDRTLAGYFLAEFNKSCNSQDRAEEAICKSYSY